jgi:hypothetical protein
MAVLIRCSACGGFVPESVTSCPNCKKGSPLGRAAKACLKLATGSAVAMTLMACYGAPPHQYAPIEAPPAPCQNDGPGDPNATSPSSPGQPGSQCSGPAPANTLATGSPQQGPPPQPGPPGS